VNRTLVIGFGPSALRPTENPADPIPVRLSLPDWKGDIGFAALQRTLRALGLVPSELGLDFFTVALGVYAADLCTNRGEFGDDAWTRHLDVEIEVSDIALWSAAVVPLVKGLRFLSNDVWRFSFRQRLKDRTELGFRNSRFAQFRPTGINLFSGGLDSAIGAIDCLSRGEALLLASTAGERQTGTPQRRVFNALRSSFPGAVLRHVHQPIIIPSYLKRSSESSQRARSILFLGFGALIASCYSPDGMPLTVAENGLIALNVPTRANRMASNSTKTTHPFLLSRVRETLAILGLNMEVREPYRFSTKGEMIAATDRNALSAVMPETVSCAKAAQLFRQRTRLLHCGSCTACLIRRASIAAGWPAADPTPGYFYTPVLDGETIEADNTRGGDIRAFKAAAARLAAEPTRAYVDVYRSGPMFDVRREIRQYAEVYSRGLTEVGRLLEKVATSASQS